MANYIFGVLEMKRFENHCQKHLEEYLQHSEQDVEDIVLNFDVRTKQVKYKQYDGSGDGL